MKNKAFTLIELLVVVLIIGILAAIAVPQYKKAVLKSRAAEAVITLKALSEAQEAFYMANGEYTNDIGELDVKIQDELIDEEGATTGKFTDKYSYSCKENRTCIAQANNANMPFFEFDLPHDTRSGNAGKKYCHVWGNTKNDTAKSICQSMGVLDTDNDAAWFVGKYYRLN